LLGLSGGDPIPNPFRRITGEDGGEPNLLEAGFARGVVHAASPFVKSSRESLNKLIQEIRGVN